MTCRRLDLSAQRLNADVGLAVLVEWGAIDLSLHAFDHVTAGHGDTMVAAEALKTALSFGIRLVVDGDDLVLTGSGPPPSSLLDLLKRHKPEIMALLRLMSGTSMLTKVNLERMAKAAYHRNLELSWPGLPPRALAGAAHETDDPRRPANLAKTTCQE
jgi:hypothetical protein